MNNTKLISKLLDKWPVKVLSLAAALLISIFYRMSTLQTRFFTVPLLVETSDTMIPVNSLANAVRISLRGDPDGIQQILEDDIEAYIDLGRYTYEGTYMAPVQIRKKGTSVGIEGLEISVTPIETMVVLEQYIRRSIPIFPVFSGTIAYGYELTDQQIIPEEVIVEGPRSALENKNEFNTEIIDIDRRFENFSVRVNIINNNPLVIIHGDKMIEYRGNINRIIRESISEIQINDLAHNDEDNQYELTMETQ